MSNESTNEPLPWDVRYATFLEKGTWFFIMANGQKFYAKIPTDQVARFIAGDVAEAFHPLSSGLDKLEYLPSLLGLSEPWYLTSPSVFAPVHAVRGLALDKAVQEAIAGTAKPEEPKLLKPGPRKLILP